MWFLLSLIAGFFFAANRLMVRFMLTRGNDPLSSMGAHNIIAGLLLLPVVFWQHQLPVDAASWVVLVLATVAFFVADLCAFLSLQKIEAALYQIIGQLRHVVILFGALVLFDESLSAGKVFSVTLLVFGVAIALAERRRITFTRGMVYAVASAVFMSFAFLLIKLLAGNSPAAFSASFGLIMSGLMTYTLLFRASCRSSRSIITQSRNKLLIAAGLFAGFELAIFAAVAVGEASKVAPVTQSALVFTLIGGFVFIGERERLPQKVIGSLCIILAVGLLYFA